MPEIIDHFEATALRAAYKDAQKRWNTYDVQSALMSIVAGYIYADVKALAKALDLTPDQRAELISATFDLHFRGIRKILESIVADGAI